MITSDCSLCTKINELENELDIEVQKLKDVFSEEYNPVIEHNNNVWKEYVKLANVPILGFIYRKFKPEPKDLKEIPRIYKNEKLAKKQEYIFAKVDVVENIKNSDLKHWGDELVSADLVGDVAGYYSPSYPISKKNACNPIYAKKLADVIEKSGVLDKRHEEDFDIEKDKIIMNLKVEEGEVNEGDKMIIFKPRKYNVNDAVREEKPEEKFSKYKNNIFLYKLERYIKNLINGTRTAKIYYG